MKNSINTDVLHEAFEAAQKQQIYFGLHHSNGRHRARDVIFRRRTYSLDIHHRSDYYKRKLQARECRGTRVEGTQKQPSSHVHLSFALCYKIIIV